MDLRHKYIKALLNNIFNEKIKLTINEGYIDFDSNILEFFPIHNDMQKLMLRLKMTTFYYDNNQVVVYGGEYKGNWNYDFFDTDDILELINGRFDFQMSLECEDSVDGITSQRARVSVWNNKIQNFYIDMDHKDIHILKDGVWI